MSISIFGKLWRRATTSQIWWS